MERVLDVHRRPHDPTHPVVCMDEPPRQLIGQTRRSSAAQPDKAKALWDRFEFIHTPKHGSWLNMAEIKINVMVRQCLNRRMANIETVHSEVAAWQASRDQIETRIDWQFTTDTARTKLKRPYPTFGA